MRRSGTIAAVLLLAVLAAGACQARQRPSPPRGTVPPSNTSHDARGGREAASDAALKAATRVTGAERIEWDQEAPSAQALETYRFVAFVGLAPAELADTQCDPRPRRPGEYVCRGSLPHLSPGPHLLRIVAIARVDGRDVASPRSRPLLVLKDEPVR